MPDFEKYDTIDVARGLLGHYLCLHTSGGRLTGMIVETEAYLSDNDPACHASRGMTERNKTMFGPAGRAYVYLIYGIYYCLNVVTGPAGRGEAVLIRAVEPLEGLGLMFERRGRDCQLTNLTSGPGKLCQAFGIDKIYDGHDLRQKPLFIAENPALEAPDITATPRIGINTARDRLLRFIIKENKHLSRRE